MRVAILSDIHGNQFGLEAVLADIESKNVDEYWFLGDYCFGGGQPAEVLETISDLPSATFIYGNGDQYLIKPEYPSAEDLATVEDSDTMKTVLNSWCDLSWTIGAIAKDGWLDWLRNLPLEVRRTLPDGTTVLLVHASPGTCEGGSLTPDLTDDVVRERFGMAEEDLIIIGHMHFVQDRRLDNKRLFNPGCVGKPIGKELRASYAILDADDRGYSLTPYYVEYDTEAFLAQLHQVNFPTPSYMEKFYRGNHVPPWDRQKA